MSQRKVARGFSLESAGKVSNALDPTSAQDYATKAYVDTGIAGVGGGGGGGGGVTKLYDYTVAGADKASIDTFVDGTTVANFAGYDVIEVWIIAQTDDGGIGAAIDLTFNNDTGAKYDQEVMYATTSSTPAAANVTAGTSWGLNVHGQGGTSGYPAVIQFTIAGYASTTFYKVAAQQNPRPDASAGDSLILDRTLGFRDTAAITRMKIAGQGAAKLKVGSRLIVFAR